MSLVRKIKNILLVGMACLLFIAVTPAHVSLAASEAAPVNEDADEEIPNVTQEEYQRNLPGVTPITVSQFVDMQNWFHKPYILFVGYKECQYCRAESTELHQFLLGNKVPVFYLNMDTAVSGASQTELAKFAQSVLPYQIQYTPTFISFAHGHAVDYDDGYPTTAEDLQEMQEQILNN
jgi:predicted bacteriocin transport accessory protein